METKTPDWMQVQIELNELFRRYGLSVATGLTREGITIMSQDKRVDTHNLGEVTVYNQQSRIGDS